ncbi:MAG: cyclopropane-fatty-acyl-phospholipid synthase family protein [Woeseiaceae bacterium]|nr:cyclopropane-fatty-acyl-phospholipid synthase family protein [Woeseiaceae bacterium]
MSAEPLESTDFPAGASAPGAFDRFARRLVHTRLRGIRDGQLTIREQDASVSFGTRTERFPEPVEIRVADPRFFGDVAFGGSIGAGEAYIRGYWSANDLTRLVRLLLANREALDNVDSGLARLGLPLQRVMHWLNRNTRKGSRRNIAAHYDLGNDFYRLWLDQRMMYSSAIFETPDMPLDEAATLKLDRICEKLELGPGDSVLEIGSGWGGFAIHAAENYGCRVTTTTISDQQFEYAGAAIAKAGLGERITLLKQDYRDLEGRFDKLVSIEMIEAVGHQYHETFFDKCASLLKPAGRMLLQAITIRDQRYASYRNEPDFIRKYIFPGGCLTSVTDMCRILTAKTDMQLVHLEDIGLHYARTLRCWRERFFAAVDSVRTLGYSEDFIRMWDYYLSFCEGGFAERELGDVQMLILKPEAR